MPDIKFRVKRQDPNDRKNPEAHWEEYTVTYEGENLTVLEGLFYIQEKIDGSLSFRYCCRASICGSCAMYDPLNCLTASLSRLRSSSVITAFG